jgi:uncharacterized protein (TIGR00725 family)
LTWKAVAVIGGADHNAEMAELAYKVGRQLAEAGCAVVCGGTGGVMEAVCRGAKSSGGLTIGILGGSDPAEANACVDVPICTGLGEARNTIVVRCASESVIAIGGEFGTLSEIGFALKLGKRVIGLKTWEFAQAAGKCDAIEVAQTADEAVRLALVDQVSASDPEGQNGEPS